MAEAKPTNFTFAVLFSRAGLVGATLLTTWAGAVSFADMIFRDGVTPANPRWWLLAALWTLFTVLFLWVAQGFWTATIGLLHMLRNSPNAVVPLRPIVTPRRKPGDLPRTAVVMPVYNEDPTRVYAGLEAMIRSIRQTGYESAFDWFILSDTRDPRVWVQEELHFAALRDAVGDSANIYYRRRHKNSARKSGNLEDFCTRFGSAYTFMLVLDADSVMDGYTVVELVHRAAERDDIGILQAPPTPVGRLSFFARAQQFAARVYGEVFTTGFSMWTHLDGNYYGHNALIRVEPFIKHCGLPLLPGKPPLGGEILSHDFVEAALMRKAGYKVKIAYDLSGSYEECPTTLLDYAQRDQRWCQGNLQHLRLVFTRGYHPLSRVHLGMGVMSYLASPLWLAFMLMGLIVAGTNRWLGELGAAPTPSLDPLPPHLVGVLLFLAVMLMLLMPKFYAVCLLLQRPALLRAHGGEVPAVLSALLEVCVSVLIAPLMMVYHTRFVLTTFAGRTVNWGKQNRDESEVGWADAWRDHWRHMVIGLVALTVVWFVAPVLVWWASPVFAGLILAVPVAKLLSSASLGRWLRDRGLLMIPEEAHTPRILRRFAKALRRTTRLTQRAEKLDPLDRLVADPALLEVHRLALEANREPFTPDADVRVEVSTEKAMHQGLGGLDRPEQLAVLSTPGSLQRLHRYAWASWPAEPLAKVAKDPLGRLIAKTRLRRVADATPPVADDASLDDAESHDTQVPLRPRKPAPSS